MKLLFDASSIAEILKERMKDAVNSLAGASTLDLAIYELGNVVWKESRVRGRTEEDTSTIIAHLEKVLGVMDLSRIRLGDVESIEGNAVRLSISFYDASYLTVAKKLGKTLVTEDEQLRKAAEKAGVLCLSVTEIPT